jgi:hypothetical protein
MKEVSFYLFLIFIFKYLPQCYSNLIRRYVVFRRSILLQVSRDAKAVK